MEKPEKKLSPEQMTELQPYLDRLTHAFMNAVSASREVYEVLNDLLKTPYTLEFGLVINPLLKEWVEETEPVPNKIKVVRKLVHNGRIDPRTFGRKDRKWAKRMSIDLGEAGK
jgi:hypothetical protein